MRSGLEAWIGVLLAVGMAVGVAATESGSVAAAERPLRVLVIGGQNNHDWSKSTPYMRQVVDKSGLFEATINNAPPADAPKDRWDAWRPVFAHFDCVVLDYNGQMWPEPVQKAFVDYVRGGGGVVVIHAANNSFTGWKEYEQMVALLWRGSDYGKSLYVDEAGKVVVEEPGKGRGMGHGGQYDWKMTVRDTQHPITRDMPVRWLHKMDELYHGQRGPAAGVHILLTAYSDPKNGGTGKEEPIVWWTQFGKGRVVTNVMGHVGSLAPMECIGFKTLLIRGCQWAATGKCTAELPANFPTAQKTSVEP